MEFKKKSAIEVTVFDGTRKDVYDSLESLVVNRGFKLYTNELVIRDLDEVHSRHDINKGDFILFMNPKYSDVFAVGFSVSDRDTLEHIVYAVGILEGLDEDAVVGITTYDVGEDPHREMLHDLIEEFDDEREAVIQNFKDILLVEASKQQIYDVIQDLRGRASQNTLDMYNVKNYEDVDEVKVESVEDITDGFLLIGEAQREDETPQIAVLGYNVEDKDMLKFLDDVFSVMKVMDLKDNPPKIIRQKFEDSRLGFELN